MHPKFLDEVAGRFADCFFLWTEMQLQMIKRDENKLPTSLKSGLLKLDVLKHFLGEDYSSCKDQQLFPVPGLRLPCSAFSGQDLLIIQNPTQMLLLS